MATATTLAAVLFIELADFTDLLSADERVAVAALEAYRAIVDPIFADHSGDIVDSTGTELLVVFSSAVAAVQCSLHLSLALRHFGEHRGSAASLAPRIGVHLGEIWRDGSRVYGNGVNIAARVMQETPPGALIVTEDVYRQVSGKLELDVRPLGSAALRNIERHFDLYEVDTGRGFLSGGEPRAVDRPDVAAPPPRPVPPAGFPGDAFGARLRDSILREVDQALAGVPGAIPGAIPGHQHGSSPHGGPPSAKTEREPRPPPPSGHPRGELDSEAAMERASELAARSVKRLVMSGGIGAALVYGFAATSWWPFLPGAVLFGLLPFVSNLGRFLSSKAEIRALDRRRRG